MNRHPSTANYEPLHTQPQLNHSPITISISNHQTYKPSSPSSKPFSNPRIRLFLSFISLLCFLISISFLLTYLALSPSTHSIITKKRIQPIQAQIKGTSITEQSKFRQIKIRQAFLEAYDDYVNFAWEHDEVKPISHGFEDSRNGWGATIVDSMTTLFVMGIEDRLQAAINHTLITDFNRSRVSGQATSVFETTIRYLGGILSIYELTESKDHRLLKKAIEIANPLQMAWYGSSKIPHPWIDFKNLEPNYRFDTSIAEAGSLTLEFDRLSFWTGNDSYRLRADTTNRKIMSNPQIFPGLHSQYLNLRNGMPRGDHVGWGGNIDSFLEYAVKYWQLIGPQANDYIKYWQEAVESSRKHLLRWSKDRKLPYLTEFAKSEGGTRNYMTHLACFAPGNWMLGGKLLDIDEIFELGLSLTETCYESYRSTQSGLGPEKFTSDGTSLIVIDGVFILRPEVLESIWYAWRLTGDEVWQDRAWKIFESLQSNCKLQTGGYRGLRNVNRPDWGSIDSTESFVFAEFFKYLYLIFAPREQFSLDEYVFSTEGHPFKIRSKKPDLYLNTSDSISINEFASHPDLPLLLSLYPKLQDKEP